MHEYRRARPPHVRAWIGGLGLLAFAVAACDTLGSFAVEAGDFAGAKSDAYCDRRFVTDGGTPEAFCQEVISTVAASQFADDCRAKHEALAAPGSCPRAQIIAGCKLLKANDDKSEVTDWYYDVSNIIAEAGLTAEGESAFDIRPRSVAEVAALCADRSRYEDGAELARP